MATDTLVEALIPEIFDLKRDIPNLNLIEKRDYHPIQTSNGNGVLNESSVIVFEHNNNQNPITLFDSVLKVTGKFTKDDGVTMLPDADLELENNWGYSLFNSAKLQINGSPVEEVENLRTATSLLGHCVKSTSYCKTYGEMEGWIPDSGDKTAVATNLGWVQRTRAYKNTTQSFELILPLESIFGFCDVRKVIYLANISLTLTRNATNELIFFNNAAPAAADKGKVILTDVRWLIRVITPSLSVKSNLINTLMENSFIPFSFMRRYTYGGAGIPAGSSYDWIIKTTSGHPRYVLVGFKGVTANTAGHAVNNALYEPVGINSIRVNLNGNKYPDPAMTLDFTNGKVSDGYLAYVNFCLKFGVEPPLSLYEWTNFYTIFCFDTSYLAEQILVGSIQVQIEIKRESTSPQAYAYCLLMEDENNKGFNTGQGRFQEYK